MFLVPCVNSIVSEDDSTIVKDDMENESEDSDKLDKLEAIIPEMALDHTILVWLKICNIVMFSKNARNFFRKQTPCLQLGCFLNCVKSNLKCSLTVS